ncbi:MAG: DUF4065 domain-containing protein [Puniceicoccales bacterium]|jgi:uncharacterized phage-associated protein|nr:DUF4065 domain-containing protein [Puniceicoccales bacterium]
MVNIFTVSKHILHIMGREISTMHLQKLCYYCQAWHLVWYGEPLFPEDFERWDNGPVCRELFEIHRGQFAIGEEHIPKKLLTDEELSKTNIDTIDQVIDDYGMFNGAQLDELARKEDPWKNTPKDTVIPKEAIENFYFGLWEGEEDDSEEDVAVSEEEIRREIEAAKDSPTYENADELFRAILGDEEFEALLGDKSKTETNAEPAVGFECFEDGF